MNPTRRGTGTWTQISSDVTNVLLDIPNDTQPGDLLLILFGARQAAVQVTWPSYVTEVASAQDGTSPKVYAAWCVATEDIIAADGIPVAFDRDTRPISRIIAWDGNTVDFSDPVQATCRNNGFTTANIVTNPTVPNGWADHEPTSQGTFAAGALSVTRDNQSNFAAGTSWNTDIAGGVSGSGDGNGVRGRLGFAFGSSGGTSQAGGTTFALSNATGNNAAASSIGFLVQGLTQPQPPVSGDPFSYSQDGGSLDVTFTDLTENDPREWSWDFGDSSTGESQNPTHTYAVAGTYDVVLTATNPAGTLVTSTVTITVDPPPPFTDFLWANVLGSDTKVSLHDQSVLADSLLWEVYDDELGTNAPTTYTTPDVVHDFGAPGDYLVRLTATNAAGSASKEVVVTVKFTDEPPQRDDGTTISVAVAMDGRWTPITCRVMDMSWSWGSQDDIGVLSIPEASGLTIRLADTARLFDPENTSSPYYGEWNIGSPLRIRLGDGDGMWTVWQGYIDDLEHDLMFCVIRGGDAIARVSNFEADINGPLALVQQSASDRLQGLLNVARWPESRRNVDSGGQVLQAITVEESSVWEAMLEVQKNDLGRLMVTQDGTIEYQSRGTAWASTDPVMLIGCPTPDGDVPDVGAEVIQLAGAARPLYNLVRAGRVGADGQTYRRQESIDKYGRFTATETNLLLTTQAAVDSWVEHLLDRHAEPSYQGRGVAFYVKGPLVGKVAQLKMGDLIRIYDDTHGQPIDFTARLLGIQYTVGLTTTRCAIVTTQDFPLTSGDREFILDTDTDFSSSIESANTKVVGTGEDAVLSLDKA